MAISKKDMAARAKQSGEMAQTIEDRLRHARDLASSHPADDTPAPAVRPYLSGASNPTGPGTNSQLGSNGARNEIVAIELIDQNPYNARRIYRTERISELAASIGAHGQDIPGVATYRNGRYVLAAGHYRYRALKLLGAKTMSLMVHDGLSDRDLYAHSYRENSERESQTTLDNALAWRELLDKGVYASETAIAEATGQSQSNVNKTMSVLRLSNSTIDIIKEDPKAFALSALYELVLYEAAAGFEAAAAMAKLVLAGEAGRKEVQEARARIEAPRERKRKENSRQYKIQREGVSLGSLKEWDSGKVALEVMLQDPKERSSLMTILRERFGIND